MTDMPSRDHCCVPLCTNRREKRSDLSYHTFPKEDVLRRKWTQAIRRDEGDNFSITPNTVVCSSHFRLSDFSPLAVELVGDSQARKRRLKKDAVPSVFSFRPPPRPPRPSLSDRLAAGAVRAREMDEKKQRAVAEAAAAAAAAQTEGERNARSELDDARKEIEESRRRIAELESQMNVLKENNAGLRSRLLSFDNVKQSEEKLKHLSGLTPPQWEALWKVLDIQSKADVMSARSAAKEEKGRKNARGAGRDGTVTLEDQLLMTLMRVRLGWQQQELAYIFEVSEVTVSLIFKKWINFLYLRLARLPLWPSWKM